MKQILYKIYLVLPVGIRRIISFFAADKFTVGLTAIVIDDAQILLVKTSYNYYWSLPGGFMDRGESIGRSVCREIKEETGIVVDFEKVIDAKSHFRSIDIVVCCKVINKSVIKIDKKEIEAAQFFPLNKLPEGILSDHRSLIKLYKQEQ